ncbi:hypothetical protein V2J09_001112 [Rumex salicifolius]
MYFGRIERMKVPHVMLWLFMSQVLFLLVFLVLQRCNRK